MLRKKEAYTVITPIPSFIPRQLALDILHSHSEVITLNPLVLSHKAIPAPRNAAADEYYSTWYEITERVQVVPGAGKLGSSKIVFNGCFHDMPWGLQTHIYAPFNIDTRNRYRIGGNPPGLEPPEVREIGLEALGAPNDGLYLREDIEIRCNISLVSFVKAQNKAASKEMVNRIIRKAELLDAGVLQAMMDPDGRLKTLNPNDRSRMGGAGGPQSSVSGGSPTSAMAPPLSTPSPRPTFRQSLSAQAAGPGGYPQYGSPIMNRPPSQHAASPGPPGPYQSYYSAQQQHAMGAPPIPPKEQIQGFHMELPGDYYHQGQGPQPQGPPQQQQQQQQNPQGYQQPPQTGGAYPPYPNSPPPQQGYSNYNPGGGTYYAELPAHEQK